MRVFKSRAAVVYCNQLTASPTGHGGTSAYVLVWRLFCPGDPDIGGGPLPACWIAPDRFVPLMDTRDRLLGLIQSLYRAPGSREGWHAFLLDLCTALDGTGANLISHDLTAQRAGVSVAARTAPEAIRDYVGHWGQEDPWAYSPRAHTLVAGRVVTGDELIGRADLRRTAFYNDFSQRFDITQCLAAMVEANSHVQSVLSVNASDARARFGAEDVTLMDGLLPHLQGALHVHRRLVDADALTCASLDALDGGRSAVLLLDRRGRLRHANRLAAALLRERDGLRETQGELRASRPPDTTTLRQLIARAIKTAEGAGVEAGGRLALVRPSGRRSLQVVVAPVMAPPGLFAEVPVAAVLFVTDPERVSLPSEQDLRTVLGLSPAEARLACALAQGLSVAEAAQRLATTPGSLRTRLKAIFVKTGTHRQVELVRLILTIQAPDAVLHHTTPKWD